MVLFQKWPFFQVFFQAIQARKICFTIIQNEKTPFQAIKTTSSKSRKIIIFPKGLTHGLVQNWPFFQFSSLDNIGQQNVFYHIQKRENGFLGFKNKKFIKSKNWYCSNFFFLGNIGQENVFYDILEQKNAFLGYNKKKFKRSTN